MYLGIELGSTRIKSVLIDKTLRPVAVGGHNWENKLENGLWTYSIPDIWSGLHSSFADLASGFGGDLPEISGLGISGMMHGYLPLDKDGNVLSQFCTWRNTNTEQAANILREKFSYNIPLRWSIAHLYQAILNNEEHVIDIACITTLAGYVHFKLTGKKVIGIGDASGVFPIDSERGSYDDKMIKSFDSIIADKSYDWKLIEILPKVLKAGESAGQLTAEGARLLDPSGCLREGIKLCPPEGDAGTGMVATNSVAAGTGNVSSGTSIFAMVVLERPLSKVYPELDMVTTPDGSPVAMVHCNNGTSDLDKWAFMFSEIISACSGQVTNPHELFKKLYLSAMEGEADGGGLMACNYLSGEHNTGFEEGRPLFMRLPTSELTMANFMRTMLMSMMASLKLGMDILENEGVKLTQLLGHGGFFKTPLVGQKLMAGALKVPVTVMENAGEGGAWGIALLAAYLDYNNQSLDEFLNEHVFVNHSSKCVSPDDGDVKGFAKFMERYKACLEVELTAVSKFR